MAIPFPEIGRTRTEHCSNRHKIFEKEMISTVASLNSFLRKTSHGFY